MEQTGEPNRIQISQATADLLVAAGKSHWITLREHLVGVKGKGKLQTYWVHSAFEGTRSSTSGDTDPLSQCHITNNNLVGNGDQVQRLLMDKTNRLIDWNVDILTQLLKQVMSGRSSNAAVTKNYSTKYSTTGYDGTPMQEVVEIVSLPSFDPRISTREKDVASVTLPVSVVKQLRDYVSNIAAM
jgi:hypothetical protein